VIRARKKIVVPPQSHAILRHLLPDRVVSHPPPPRIDSCTRHTHPSIPPRIRSGGFDPLTNDRRLESSKEDAAKTKVRSINIEETGIMICDATKGTPQVTFVSAVWSQLTGITSEAACSKTLWDLFSIPGTALATCCAPKECLSCVFCCLSMWRRSC